MTRLARESLLEILALTFAAMVCACTSPATEALIEVETDIPADRAVDVTVTATDGEAGVSMRARWAFDAGRVDAGHRVASFAVVPGAGPRDGVVALLLDAVIVPRSSGDTPLDLRRRLTFRFAAGRTIEIPVFLSVRCLLPATGCTLVPATRCTRSELCEEQGATCGADGQCVSTALGTDGGLDAFDAPNECVPACTGRQCGDDGCGGSCGTCSAGLECDVLTGLCVCAPACGTHTCGPDGCGGVCGTCPAGSACGTDGACHSTCGGPSQACCPAAPQCASGLMCDASTHQCVGACGGSGQSCCGGTACAPSLVCRAGTCAACPTGQVPCGGMCVSTATDVTNCGACGNACSGGQSCVSGTCRCAAPTSSCGGVCVNLSIDPNDCGACGNVCATGQVCCSGACIDTSSDVSNCGSCGHACGAGFLCRSGVCTACGQDGQPCCASMACNTGLACELSRPSRTYVCTPCGAVGQVCCGGSTCNAGAICSSGFCAACGAESQPCCAGNSCNAGYTCNSTRTEIPFGCIRCGAGGEPCCTSGAACNSGLARTTVVPGTDLCTTMTSNVPGGPCTTPPDSCTGASFCRNAVCYACGGFDLFCCGNIPTGMCNTPYACHELGTTSNYACW